MGQSLITGTNPGAASWIQALNAILNSGATTEAAPTGGLLLAYTDFMAGSSPNYVEVPVAGTYLVRAEAIFFRNGALGGTPIQQRAGFSFTLNGETAVGNFGAIDVTTDLAHYFFAHTQILSLAAGDQIGGRFGFLGAQATSSLTASGPRSISAQLV